MLTIQTCVDMDDIMYTTKKTVMVGVCTYTHTRTQLNIGIIKIISHLVADSMRAQ